MRKIKKEKHPIDQIGDYSESILGKLQRQKKISCIYYFMDRDSEIGIGRSIFYDTEELCKMFARVLLDNAEALRMDPLDLICLIEEKTKEDRERPEKDIERNISNKKSTFYCWEY